MLMVLSAVAFNSFSTEVSCLLLMSMAFFAMVFSIKLFCLYQTIAKDLLATLKLC